MSCNDNMKRFFLSVRSIKPFKGFSVKNFSVEFRKGCSSDSCVAALPTNMKCKPLRIEWICGNPLELLLNYFCTLVAFHTAYIQGKVYPGTTTAKITNESTAAVVLTPILHATATTYCFFERRLWHTIRAPLSQGATVTWRLG